MKYDKFFELAKNAGITDAELYISESSDLSFGLFHGEVTSYENNNAKSFVARGIVNGRFGSASCDVWDSKRAEYLVNEIKSNALVTENDDPAIIFAGSPKYKKVSTYNKELENVSFDEKLTKLLELEREIKNGDAKVTEVAEVEYSEKFEATTILNSKGLKLTQKANYFVAFGVAVASDGSQVKSDYDLYLGNDFNKFDPKALAKKIVSKTVAQLGGEAPKSANYKAILAPSVVTSFLRTLVSYASSEEVQRKSSLFIGKLGKKVASSKITVEDRPLEKTVFARSFDDEGVATYNKPIIKSGVLQGYLYNLKTAAKENVESTGNGYRRGDAMGVSSSFLYLKPGKKSQEELFALVGDGVYITQVSGLHAGLNAQSGDFSLQSSGFLIKDGKLDRGLDIITVSGNILKLFEDVKEVGSDIEVSPSGVACSSLFVKKLTVSGK